MLECTIFFKRFMSELVPYSRPYPANSPYHRSHHARFEVTCIFWKLFKPYSVLRKKANLTNFLPLQMFYDWRDGQQEPRFVF